MTQIGDVGSGPGQLGNPFAVTAQPASGHVYVAEVDNSRISEFTAWGEFVKAWGWGVVDGSPELQVCTAATGCQAGLSGDGPGQISFEIRGIVIDSGENVYVSEGGVSQRRVQKFDADGNFVWMAGGGVNKGPNHPGNLCTAVHLSEGDSCGGGSSGAGPGEFASRLLRIAIGPSGTLYVGDAGRIEEFSATGAYLGEIAVPGEVVNALAVDASGIYAVYGGATIPSSKEDVRKLSFAGAEVDRLEAQDPRALATDVDGNVYVTNQRTFEEEFRKTRIFEVLAFDSAGNCFICQAETIKDAFANFAAPEDESTSLFGIATNVVTSDGDLGLYVTTSNTGGFAEKRQDHINAYGSAPTLWPPPLRPPLILAQYAATVNPDSATVAAEINPMLWSDTRYYLELGTSPCSLGGCVARPVPPGSLLTPDITNSLLKTQSMSLDDLQPATTYHYRFVAQSSGGGPVFGVDPDGAGPEQADFANGQEATFSTPADPTLPPPCANAAFRGGAGTYLPDCRAYEMVSPLDKSNGDIAVQANIIGDPAGLDQAATSGGKLTYSASRAFKGSAGAPYTSQYIASRDPALGWSSTPISPPQAGTTGPVSSKDSQFKAFSDDLSQSWLQYGSDISLEPGIPPGFLDLYRRDSASGAFEAAIRAEPANGIKFWPELQGISTDGKCAVFRANSALTGDAALIGFNQVYRYCNGGSLDLVSVLPGGLASGVESSVGTGGPHKFGRESRVFNAVSDDASHVYWTTESKLYLWTGGGSTAAVSSGQASFWSAAADGSRAIYSEGKNLLEFELGAGSSKVAGGFMGFLGASGDASRIYFVSSEALQGDAEAGMPNLYLDDQGELVYIATLSQTDARGDNQILSPVDPFPVLHAARVTADGGTAVFVSNARLSPYDNIETASGEPVGEVYRYDAGDDSLICVSCNPSGARPVGRDLERKYNLRRHYRAAATISPAANQLTWPRVVSDDGDRVYFDSFDPLVARDVNGVQDVYQWEALGTGSCTTAAPGFAESSGGCLDLISSGESPKDSSFVDADPSGSNVFLKTSASLDPRDSGLIDVYVARTGGGFPPPVPPPLECVGEACQHPPGSPESASPASGQFVGPANPKSSAKPCPKGNRKARHHNGRVCAKRKGKSRAGGKGVRRHGGRR